MNFLFFIKDGFSRAFERKKTLLILAIVFCVGIICGILFIKTPAIYGYHLNLCDKYIDRVCYSERNVFLIMLERFAGGALLVCFVLASGFHPVCLVLPTLLLFYRAYTFGGSIVIFFSVYRMSGALIVFGLYLPVHLLIDGALFLAAAFSFARAPHFCTSEFRAMLFDLLFLLVLVAAICLFEIILLLVLFRPIGSLL